MKTKRQVIDFFKSNHFATAEDCEMVSLFCQNNCGLTPKDFPTFTTSGSINSQTFIEWYRSGFGVGDIVFEKKTGSYYVVSSSSIANIQSCAILSNLCKTGKKWKPNDVKLDATTLSSVSEIENKAMTISLAEHGYEFDYDKKTLRKKYIPEINERVEFSRGNYIGLGVVRSINPVENSIEFFCYFIYSDKKIGYSMHESGICDVMSFQFNPMTVVAARRLNRELEKYGKVWNDKLHRIESIDPKVAKGEKYWYISDKMTVVTDREKGTPTSHFRYIAGNYFKSYDEALEYLGKFHELLRDRLAK
jgi:hypothetical protein|nr:MAG TPA: hypothetical protein [Bacteriophage sp.]